MVVGAAILVGASITASVLIIQAAVLPLVFKYSKFLQRKLIFSNCINFPKKLNYENPSSCRITGARYFSITFYSLVDKTKIKIGAWHVIPKSMYRKLFVDDKAKSADVDSEIVRELAVTKLPIILYCHGNANHRASPFRLYIYRVFQNMNYHVITFDYRGYGDSTRVRPTERGVVEDTLRVYSWLQGCIHRNGDGPLIVLWGHSLGTGVAAHLVSNIKTLSAEMLGENIPQPDGLILESAFNNLTEEILRHPCSKLVNWLPYYNSTFIEPFIKSTEYSFDTDQYLAKAPEVPVLILHAKRDWIVPHRLATKLHTTLCESRRFCDNAGPLIFHTFSLSRLGHNNLCTAPDFKEIVEDFVTQLQDVVYSKFKSEQEYLEEEIKTTNFSSDDQRSSTSSTVGSEFRTSEINLEYENQQARTEPKRLVANTNIGVLKKIPEDIKEDLTSLRSKDIVISKNIILAEQEEEELKKKLVKFEDEAITAFNKEIVVNQSSKTEDLFKNTFGELKTKQSYCIIKPHNGESQTSAHCSTSKAFNVENNDNNHGNEPSTSKTQEISLLREYIIENLNDDSSEFVSIQNSIDLITPIRVTGNAKKRQTGFRGADGLKIVITNNVDLIEKDKINKIDDKNSLESKSNLKQKSSLSTIDGKNNDNSNANTVETRNITDKI